MNWTINPVEGGITAAEDFLAGGIASGIKGNEEPDLAVIMSRCPVSAAGVFTTNRVCAAPVVLSRAHLRNHDVRVIVANSGNANACTGETGTANALRTAAVTAESLGIKPGQVLVASTGRIGVQLPMEILEAAIPRVLANAGRDGSPRAARAIMTSDTRPKECAVEVLGDNFRFRVGGIAKGAGMINPDMATMLCFVSTDANLSQTSLQKHLTTSVDRSFNRITVDGDMSTNDTVLLLANGAAGGRALQQGTAGAEAFQAGLDRVTHDLALQIVADGECATRLISVHVRAARTEADALLAAKAIANSILTKSAWSGGDPNWGRILCAAGYSGARFDAEKVDMWLGEIPALRSGTPVPNSKETLTQVVSGKEFTVTLDLHAGSASTTVWTTDLTPEYIVYNQSE